MLTIHLNKLIFHAYHGIYEEEKIIGNDFEVNVAVTFEAKSEIHTIYDTVDYVSLHRIIKKLMNKPTPLIETVVQQMGEEIKLFDKKITSVSISIHKLNPAITNFEGTVGISYTKVF